MSKKIAIVAMCGVNVLFAVMSDIVATMFSSKFMSEILRPQEIFAKVFFEIFKIGDRWQTFKILVCLARVIVEKFNTFFIQIFFDDDAFLCRSEYVKQRYVRFTLFRDQFFAALIKRASRRDMATHTLPLLFVNLGGEMLYVLSQRLSSQKVGIEKSQKGSFPFICCFNVSYEF